ncbi:hypothetical protein [Lichenicoccus roseus]|uniref:hypothetical protein n=1 Tax=Lichenicoccus roseus TaxID=2683649 RepID=UPI0038CF8437
MAWDDDPSVPPARSRKVSDQLGAALEIMPRGGRLNDVAGFTRFPQPRRAAGPVRVAAGTARVGSRGRLGYE